MDINQLLRSLGLQQAYQAYQQNIGEPFAAAVGGAGRGYLGFDKPEYGGLLGEEAYRMGQAMGNMPGLGAPAGAFKVGMQAAAKAPGLLADAVQMMKANPEAGLLAITGYHGSPYKFTKFDASKIGSGEGAQVYGHGLYFAENPDVARQYKQILAYKAFDLAPEAEKLGLKLSAGARGEFIRQANANTDPVKAARNLQNANVSARQLPQEKLQELFKSYFEHGGGKIYTVDIPDEMIGRMLDWDKPLSQQAPEVKKAIDDIVISEELYKGKYASRFLDSRTTAGEVVQILGEALGGANVASQYLREVGIPGVRYLDQGSRGTGKGTRNFVVFPGEEEAVRILNVE